MDRAELIKRLEKAAGSDRDLDASVAIAFGWRKPAKSGICGDNFEGRVDYEWHDENGLPYGFYPPRVTASIDAAVALVKRMLPWWTFILDNRMNDPRVKLLRPNEISTADDPVHGKTLPIALLIALLKATQ